MYCNPSGRHGCLLGQKVKDGQTLLWFPAFYDANVDDGKVRDPTGAGNAFCGALAVTFAHGGSIRVGVIMATVVASFIIEQIGMPALNKGHSIELWNGESVRSRCELYMHRNKVAADGFVELLDRLWPR